MLDRCLASVLFPFDLRPALKNLDTWALVTDSSCLPMCSPLRKHSYWGEDAYSNRIDQSDQLSLHAESPVHILNPKDKVSLTFTTSERVVLTCELSRVDFPATWYKDGQRVEENESLIVKVDGRKHRLILPEAQVQDSGEFECRTEGVSAFFSITVQGQEPCC